MTGASLDQRRGDWLQMHSGVAFWPLDPRADEVRIEDIAHSLSLLCRFGGHCRRFYSVAEHSIHVASLLPDHLKLAGLLHDASEAYVVDLPSPLKRCLPDYAEIEAGVQRAISEHFGLPAAMHPAVKVADRQMLVTEAWELMQHPPTTWGEVQAGVPRAQVGLSCWEPELARAQFIWCFERFRVLREAST